MKFCVIGHPVGHSLSPLMHAANFRSLGFDGIYEAIDITPAELPLIWPQLVAKGYRGINVTIPHKLAVAKLVDELDVSAKRCDGAVNTVAISTDGRTKGYNTDVIGFFDDLQAQGFNPVDKCVLICGAGGLGRALAASCKAYGVAEVMLANRTPYEGIMAFSSPAFRQYFQRADLIVNATALGLHEDDPSVLPTGWLQVGQFVYDCAPVRYETNTLRAARMAGARYADGLGMLVCQGALAFRIWTGQVADTEIMRQVIQNEGKGKR